MKESPVFQRLRDDHRRVMAEIADLEDELEPRDRRARGASSRDGRLRELLAMLERQFATHMVTEEEVLFTAFGEALPGSSGNLAELREEHAELRSMLARVAATLQEPSSAGREERLDVETRDLVDLLRLHIRKEEEVVFRVAEQVLRPGELEALRQRLLPRESEKRGAGRTNSKGKDR